jgi:hypothetical protein
LERNAIIAAMTELQDPTIFRTVLDSLQTGVYLIGRDRKILFWNDGAERITASIPASNTARVNIKGQCRLKSTVEDNRLEARGGIEPSDEGFADPCLTTWLPRPEKRSGGHEGKV